MRKPLPILLCDFYKISHRNMYPEGTELVYSTWTPRASRLEGVDHVIHFGLQAFIKKYLIHYFEENFFSKNKAEVIGQYMRIIRHSLGTDNPEVEHLEKLYDLGYLPISIKSLREGIKVPLRVPMFSIENTRPEFFWLTNSLETLMSCELWQASTSATIALEYKKILDKYAMGTVGNTDFVPFQGHDFSMRGMSSLDSAISSGMGHLLSFSGTDTIPAIEGAEIYYNADVEKEMIGTSIPASEHSIQCAYEDDLEYIRRLITKVHPTGMVSIVCDGYDFWKVIREVLPALKDEIMARDGKVVIRPDSGDPVKIVCGDPEGTTQDEKLGAIDCLANIFGATKTDKGYYLLDSHIGLIYGDAITIDRCKSICKKLEEAKFASINAVFGIGSYTYQYNTRDTFGFALKSTLCVINGKEKQIFKDPKTDDGTKKSQKGRVLVYTDTETKKIKYSDGLPLTEYGYQGMFKEVFRDGQLLKETSFKEIQERVME